MIVNSYITNLFSGKKLGTEVFSSNSGNAGITSTQDFNQLFNNESQRVSTRKADEMTRDRASQSFKNISSKNNIGLERRDTSLNENSNVGSKNRTGRNERDRTQEVDKNNKGKKADDKVDDKADDKKAYEMLAHILNLNLQDIKQLFEELDIDFSKLEGIENLLSKISSDLYDEGEGLSILSAEEQKLLKDMLQQMSKALVQNAEGEDLVNLKKLEESIEKIDFENTENIKQLITTLEDSIKSLGNQSRIITEESSEVVDLDIENDTTIRENEDELLQNDIEEPRAKTENNDNSSQDSNQQPTAEGLIGVSKELNEGNSVEGKQQSEFDSIINEQSNKIKETNVELKLNKETPVNKNEVLSQVIEKAKVVLAGGKSEMTMELKPESLGKLSLKIITENGIFLAEVVAENEQVKAVLESNMQTLKDSLQEQGFTIKEFSVSVGSDSQKQMDHKQTEKKKTAEQSKVKLDTTSKMNTRLNIEEVQSRLNPYYESQSSINITA